MMPLSLAERREVDELRRQLEDGIPISSKPSRVVDIQSALKFRKLARTRRDAAGRKRAALCFGAIKRMIAAKKRRNAYA